jgi:hypothetical protein
MKKSQILALATLSSCLLIQATSVAGELLKNPGFEDPIGKYDKTGWDVRGPQAISPSQVTEPVVEGKYALLVEGRSGANWEGIKQAVTLKPGTIYRLSGSIRLGKGEKSDKGAVQLLKVLDDGSKQYQDIFRSKLSSSEYTTFSETFSFDEENIKDMAISIHGMGGGKSFIIDGFSLEEVK